MATLPDRKCHTQPSMPSVYVCETVCHPQLLPVCVSSVFTCVFCFISGADIRSVCTEAGMFAIRARRKVLSLGGWGKRSGRGGGMDGGGKGAMINRCDQLFVC